MSGHIADTGLAVERTLLAWRRTALLVGGASVVAARLLADSLGPAVFAVALLGVAFAMVAHGRASARYRQSKIPTGSNSPVLVATPRRLAAMAAGTSVVATIAIAWMVTS